MKNELEEQLKQNIARFRLPRYKEITNVGLYLEQTAKFINSYLAPLHEGEITTSMISNYVKQGIIPNPEKKQYYTDHIAYLLFIAAAKTVVSLEDLRLLIVRQKELYTIEQAYNYFCDEFENILFSFFGLREKLDGLGETESEEKDLLRNMIIAVVHKIYLDQYIAVFRLEFAAQKS